MPKSESVCELAGCIMCVVTVTSHTTSKMEPYLANERTVLQWHGHKIQIHKIQTITGTIFMS